MHTNSHANGNSGNIADTFASHGTEGMLDVVLGCTLIFLLMAALIGVGDTESQEKTLPSVNLTKSNHRVGSGAKIKKNIITLRKTQGNPLIYLDDKAVSLEELKQQLTQLAGVGHVALRRDQDLPCGWEDRIIMLCQDSGIEKVSIVVSRTKPKP